MNQRFVPKEPDYERSPYTGMTRKHWKDAAKYLLDGVFCHIRDISSPVLVPRYEKEVTYPNEASPGIADREGGSGRFRRRRHVLLRQTGLQQQISLGGVYRRGV